MSDSPVDGVASDVSQDSEVESASDDDPENLIPRWLQLKVKLLKHDLTPGPDIQPHQLRKKRERILQRIKAIERDMLFDSDAASYQWLVVEKELRVETTRARRENQTVTSSTAAQDFTNVADGGEDEENMLGPMFDDMNLDQDCVADKGDAQTLQIFDFGAWNGVTPRTVLEEAWISRSLGGRPQFTLLWRGVNSFRSAIHLRTPDTLKMADDVSLMVPQGVQLDTSYKLMVIGMRDVAATSLRDSESYVSTVAIALLQELGLLDRNINIRLPRIWKDRLSAIEETKKEIEHAQRLKQIEMLQTLMKDTLSKRQTEGRQLGRFVHHGSLETTEADWAGQGRHLGLHGQQVRDNWLNKTTRSTYQSMQVYRSSLPVFNYKDEILNVCAENQVTIICADTGAGKSTQIPTYLLEAQLSQGMDVNILVTQPRRISAISIARRVSEELGEAKEELGTTRSLVGYAIRLESKTSSSTRITFATTGVLLRMLQDSPDLNRLDYLVLDEVHERTMDLDLLFIVLKRLLLRRSSIKVVLMSATVDATKFSRYFDDAPILDIPGRTFPVEVGFLEDAIELTNKLSVRSNGDVSPESDYDSAAEAMTLDEEKVALSKEYSNETRSKLRQYDFNRIDYHLISNLTVAIATTPNYTQYSQAILIFMPGIAEIRRLSNLLMSTPFFSSEWTIHLLHSSFSTEDLEKAFTKPAFGYRKIVIATNIAETGITIPDVTAVIDTCREKIMRFDERRQMSRLTEGLIARSSARQRKGRAARVQPGLCYHLVTRHHYEHKMMEQSTPEMLRLGLQEPILRIKTWSFGSIEETLAAAIDPPSLKNVHRAISRLQDAGALDSHQELTDLGRIMARLPVDVALSRLIAYGLVFCCLDAMLKITALMSLKSIYQNDEGSGTSAGQKAFFSGNSDLLTSLHAYESFCKVRTKNAAHQFCRKYHLNLSVLSQVEEQHIQLLVYCADAGLVTLTVEERAALTLARRSCRTDEAFASPSRYNTMSCDALHSAVIALALHPKLLVREGRAYRQVYTNQILQLASTSALRTSAKPSRWVCYVEAMRNKNGKTNAITASKVSETSIVLLVGNADFKLYAGVVSVDNGRMKFSLRYWRQILALRLLRAHVAALVVERMRAPSREMPGRSRRWFELLSQALVESSPSETMPERLLRMSDGERDGELGRSIV